MHINMMMSSTTENGSANKTVPKELQNELQGLILKYGAETVKKACLGEAKTTLGEDTLLAQHIVEASEDAVFVTDQDGFIRLTNPAAQTMFGWNDESLIGQNISEVIGGMHGPRHTSYLQKASPQVMQQILHKMRDLPARRKDGTEFSVAVSIKIVEERGSKLFVAYCHDLTFQKQQMEKLEREFELNKSILAVSFDCMVLTDKNGIIMRVNEATTTAFGYEADEMIGKNVALICGGEHAEHHADYMRRFHKRDGQSHVAGKLRALMARRKDGSEFPCRVGVHVVPGSDLLVGFIHDITSEIEATNLAVEKKSAEALLFNMLPREIAERLQDEPGHIADHFHQATVLFADIVGFTSLSNKLQPIEVVSFLNRIFSRFDSRLEDYGLNKLKTIGDCYMVTCIPGCKNPASSCAAVCHFACDIIKILIEDNEEHPDQPLAMRVGVNTGPVIAGVVGTQRFLYDIWGDTVNVASRMESTGVAGKVHASQAVVDTLSPDEFSCNKRGTVKVKGIGEMETYFIEERSEANTQEYGRESFRRRNAYYDPIEMRRPSMLEVLGVLKDSLGLAQLDGKDEE